MQPIDQRRSLPASSSHLDRTRVEILRVVVRSSAARAKPHRDNTFFILKVHSGSDYNIVEQSWSAFRTLKVDLLEALDKGHVCHGVCGPLHRHLKRTFDAPTNVDIATWLRLRLRRHDDATMQLYLEHFQGLLDALLRLLRQHDVDCVKFLGLRDVLARFLQFRPTTVLEPHLEMHS
ncbi:hypothetical protein ACHHYP_13247, partial [Achlya hypogyna]